MPLGRAPAGRNRCACALRYLEIETGDEDLPAEECVPTSALDSWGWRSLGDFHDADKPGQDEMLSPEYNERRISLDLTPLSCKSTDSSAE